LLWSPSKLYMFGLFARLFPSSANFQKNIWIVLLLLYSEKQYVRYNNNWYLPQLVLLCQV
jgi:hypothetical protein